MKTKYIIPTTLVVGYLIYKSFYELNLKDHSQQNLLSFRISPLFTQRCSVDSLRGKHLEDEIDWDEEILWDGLIK